MANGDDFLAQALGEFLPQVRLPRTPFSRLEPSERPWTVLLTGSTGSLGTHLVSALQQLPPGKLAGVYCLNRSEDAREKQSAALSARHLPHCATAGLFS